jgi:hypothetical protein
LRERRGKDSRKPTAYFNSVFLLAFIFRNESFHQALPAELSAQAVNVVPRYRLKNDFEVFFSQFDLNARAFFNSQLPPNGRRNHNLTL